MTGTGEALTVSKDNMGKLQDELQKPVTQMNDFDKLKNQSLAHFLTWVVLIRPQKARN